MISSVSASELYFAPATLLLSGAAFTPAIFTQSLIQYNDRTERWSTNLRFHWLKTAATGLFVVYNDTESLNGIGPVNPVTASGPKAA